MILLPEFNVVVDEAYDEFGYPITKNADVFSPDEVLIKLFGLKEKLKKDYLPLNARIIDITGEGVYFGIYKNRLWIDNLKIDELPISSLTISLNLIINLYITNIKIILIYL